MNLVADNWPPVKGDYIIGKPDSRIAVVTLASHIDACPEAAIWGSSKTENLGVEKIVVNVISNSNIRYVLVCGTESRGHLSGHSLLAIHKSGIDEQGRIMGSQGAIPFIENISRAAVERFQQQVTLIDKIGLNDQEEIRKLIKDYTGKGEAYPEEPMVICAPKRRQSSFVIPTSGDVIISGEFVMDSKAGIICSAESF